MGGLIVASSQQAIADFAECTSADIDDAAVHGVALLQVGHEVFTTKGSDMPHRFAARSKATSHHRIPLPTHPKHSTSEVLKDAAVLTEKSAHANFSFNTSRLYKLRQSNGCNKLSLT